MRICLYTETALPRVGGQEMVVDVLARELQHLGHEVTVVAPRPRPPLQARDGELPYPVSRHLPFYSMRLFTKSYRWWLNRLHRRFPFDVIHCHSIYPTGYIAARIRKRSDVPVVITSHGGDVNEASPRLQRLRPRYEESARQADALVAISRFTEEGFLRLGADPVRVRRIPNGVHAETLAVPAPRPARLDAAIRPGGYALFLGRLKQRKGVDLFLRSLALLPASAGAQAVIAGDGEERSNLEELTRSLNLQGRVRFVGPVFGDEKAYLLQNARCLVLLSRISEAFGLVVLESFAAGRPVLATRLPGLEDLIEPGRTGWLVPPESVEAPARVLGEVFSGRLDLQRAGRAAAQVAQSYSWRAIARRHVELYDELLAQRYRLTV